MNYFTRQRLMILAIVVLLLLNLATLGAFWFFRSEKSKEYFQRKRQHRVEKFLIDKLDFNARQSQELEQLMEGHRAGVMEIFKKIQASREMLYDSMSFVDSVEVEQITRRIASSQAELDRATYYHFRSIREICNPDQQRKFDTVIKEVISRHHPGNRRQKKRSSFSK